MIERRGFLAGLAAILLCPIRSVFRGRIIRSGKAGYTGRDQFGQRVTDLDPGKPFVGAVRLEDFIA